MQQIIPASHFAGWTNSFSSKLTASNQRTSVFPEAPYRSYSGPSGPKSQKSRRKVPGAESPGVKKRLKKRPKKGQKRVENNLFPTFSTCFRLFSTSLTPGSRPQEPFFSTFWGSRAQRARMTPVRGQGDCNLSSGLKGVTLIQAERCRFCENFGYGSTSAPILSLAISLLN